MLSTLLEINCRYTTRFTSKVLESVRLYAKKSGDGDCRRAIVDIPNDFDPCEKRTKPKKPTLLQKIKLKVIEGGTNFGTPFRLLQPNKAADTKASEESKLSANSKTSKALVAPEEDYDDFEEEKEVTEVAKNAPALLVPFQRGVQVSVLGADTNMGQYVALLLKQCECIKKLRLFDARDNLCECNNTARDLYHVVNDLQHIDTSCRVQLYRNCCGELERCLQNTDIVLMLESSYVNMEMPYDQRFIQQAPIVKTYADAIASECPKAFIIVCASPIECMVPLVAETLKETGWYDPRKILGSMAVPEMRASTIAARALSLEPRYTQVPCIGGTEGDSLVPLFSRAVELFDFTAKNASDLTEAVRKATMTKSEKLSEAHALSGLVTKVAHALLGDDKPTLTGFVETDISHVISPSRYIATSVNLGIGGIVQWIGFPKMNDKEVSFIDMGLEAIDIKIRMAEDWHDREYCSARRLNISEKKFFYSANTSQRFEDCAYAFQ